MARKSPATGMIDGADIKNKRTELVISPAALKLGLRSTARLCAICGASLRSGLFCATSLRSGSFLSAARLRTISRTSFRRRLLCTALSFLRSALSLLRSAISFLRSAISLLRSAISLLCSAISLFHATCFGSRLGVADAASATVSARCRNRCNHQKWDK